MSQGVMLPDQLPLGVFNPMVPKEGPRIIPLLVDMRVNNTVLIDLGQQQQSGKISFIQTIYVDNRLNTAETTVTSQTLNMKYHIPAGKQALLPFFVANPPRFLVESTGAVQVPIFVMNVPINPQVWGADGTFVGGALIVSDPALEALIANLGGGPGLNVNVVSSVGGGGGGNGAVVGLFRGYGAVNGNNNLTGVNGFNVPAGKTFFCTAFSLKITPDAQNGVGENNALILEGVFPGEIWSGHIYVPAAAPGVIGAGLIDIATVSGINYPMSSAASQPYYAWGGTSFTQGGIVCDVWGYNA